MKTKYLLGGMVIAFNIVLCGCGRQEVVISNEIETKLENAEKTEGLAEPVKEEAPSARERVEFPSDIADELSDEEDKNKEEKKDYYAQYAAMLRSFMNGDGEIPTDYDMQGYSAGNVYFTLKDLNDDGYEELLVSAIVSDSTMYYTGIYIPGDSLEDGYCGRIDSFDEETKVAVFTTGSDYGGDISFMRFDGEKLIEIEKYVYDCEEEENPILTYSDGRQEETTWDVINSYYDSNIEGYELNEENIQKLLEQ